VGRRPERFGARFDKKRARQRRYYERARERLLALARRINYGCDQAAYDRLMAMQGGVCAVCHRPETAARNGRIKYLSVDHDHRTGRIRGLLCDRHNTGIGQFNDDVEELRAAIAYLLMTTAGIESRLGSRDFGDTAHPRVLSLTVKNGREAGQLTLLDRSCNAGDCRFSDLTNGVSAAKAAQGPLEPAGFPP